VRVVALSGVALAWEQVASGGRRVAIQGHGPLKARLRRVGAACFYSLVVPRADVSLDRFSIFFVRLAADSTSQHQPFTKSSWPISLLGYSVAFQFLGLQR
jgi:hypothetical protein